MKSVICFSENIKWVKFFVVRLWKVKAHLKKVHTIFFQV